MWCAIIENANKVGLFSIKHFIDAAMLGLFKIDCAKHRNISIILRKVFYIVSHRNLDTVDFTYKPLCGLM